MWLAKTLTIAEIQHSSLFAISFLTILPNLSSSTIRQDIGFWEWSLIVLCLNLQLIKRISHIIPPHDGVVSLKPNEYLFVANFQTYSQKTSHLTDMVSGHLCIACLLLCIIIFVSLRQILFNIPQKIVGFETGFV